MKWYEGIMLGFAVFLLVALSGIVSYYFGRQKGRTEIDYSVSMTDTVYVTEFIEVETPVPYEVEVEKTVYLTDTVYVGREMFYILNYQHKKYRGEDYYAEVSGFEVNLDSIAVKVNTAYIDRPILKEVPKTPVVTWGLQLGLGCQYGLVSRRFDVGPYIGIGVEFHF